MEFPHLEKLYRKYKDLPFSVVAVESRGDRTGAKAMIEENHCTFTILFDTKGINRNSYHVYGFPTTFILDTSGNIVFRHVGFYPGMEIIMEKEIRELLNLSRRLEPSA